MEEEPESLTRKERRKVVAPTLTPEQRRIGYAKSLDVRKARQMIKLKLEAGEKLQNVLKEEHVGGIKVMDLLLSMPYIGVKRARKILADAGIPEGNTVRACGYRQIERLLEAVRK